MAEDLPGAHVLDLYQQVLAVRAHYPEIWQLSSGPAWSKENVPASSSLIMRMPLRLTATAWNRSCAQRP